MDASQVSTRLRYLLLLEWLVATVIAYAACAAGGRSLSGLAVFAAGLGIMLIGRISFVAITFILGFIYRSPRSALQLSLSLTMVVREILAFLALFVLLPFGSLWMKPDRLPPGRPILLLIHGYGCNRAVWWWFRRRLESAGFAVATISLEPAQAISTTSLRRWPSVLKRFAHKPGPSAWDWWGTAWVA